MGFIRDLVHDREIVKNIWTGLFAPDVLLVYVFVERVMHNKVNVEEAASALDVKNS